MSIRTFLSLLLFPAALSFNAYPVEAQVVVSGELKKWHKVTLTIDGVNTSETAAVNPFTDYRLSVTFTNGTKTYVVPGFYATDGHAAETSASTGNKWKAYFTPDEIGEWNYSISFRTGSYISITNDPGASVIPDGSTGSFIIEPSNKTGNDFRAKGMLRYVDSYQLQFAETGNYYLKGGTNSPENFLAYFEFDQTVDLGGNNDNTLINGLHQYGPHVQHWQSGNPTWQNGKGKGIIGSLNYLAAQHVNSVYFLTYTIDNGDGRDTWVWTSATERQRFDCSKLDQWEIVFSHMDSLGIQLHLVTQEQENDQSLGDGVQQFSNVRKLYYRELVARFGHHLAVQWNLGEENTNTNAERAAFAQYISDLDPYDHPIVVHTPNGGAVTYYDTIFATPSYLQYFEASSLQGTADKYNTWATSLRDKSNAAGRKWAIYGDEQTPSVAADGSNFNTLRRDALWGNLMGGGAGIEWYFGYQVTFGDLQSEDFTVIQPLWQYTAYALDFFQNYLPFNEMSPHDELLVNRSGDDFCLTKEGQVYAVYLETGGSANLRISIQQPGNYIVKWFNPRTGGSLQNGSVTTINATTIGNFSLGQPPVAGANDWVVLITNTYQPLSISMIKNDISCFGRNDGEAEALVSGGAPPYSYQWSNGGNAKLVSHLAAGIYIVTVTDAFLYSNSDTIVITQPSMLSVVSGVTVTNGLGEIILNVTGGTSSYSFSWSSGKKTNSIDSLASGIYCVTVTDANGCSVTQCDTVVVPQCEQPPFTCSDNNACTIDSCSNGVCVSSALNCNDSNACTNDACNAGQCAHTPIACDDNIPCTLNDCNPANGCFYTPLVCVTDGNACTIESCVNGQCVSAPIICSDQVACTRDTCNNGQCFFNPIICNDNISCTTDSCFNGICTFVAMNCDDHNICTIDNCNTSGECIYSNIACNDGNLCTADNCHPINSCFYTPIICTADNNLCTIESCVNGGCVSNPIICIDNNSCTNDACQNGQCQYSPIVCNDNNTCTVDNCSNGQCAFTNIVCNDNNGCTSDNCQNGNCVFSPMSCTDDGNACTTESCVSGQCISNPIICNDNIACTTDACQNGQCQYTPILCNDNNLCTSDACSIGQCIYTSLPLQISSLTLVNSSTDVDIRNLKTTDTINLAVTPNVNIRGNVCGSAGSIKFVINGSTFRTESTVPFSLAGDASGNYNKWSVSVGLYTLIATPYSGVNAAGTAGIAKTVTLRVINQVAPACTTNTNCNDNNACTTDACQSAKCIFTTITCNDNNTCTNDACNNGVCSNTVIVCNDNNLCTTDGCVNGTCVYTPKNCNDNDACTTDGCNAGNCLYSTRNCNDNHSCTTDGCNPANGCTNSPIANCCSADAGCNDGNTCTIDRCTNNTCQYTQGGSNPSYLRITNPSKSWRKLKLGYSTNSFFSPKLNVTASGNNMMCITLRTVGTPEWSKLQIRPQGNSSAVATLSNYISGTAINWTTICIPLSVFGVSNFTQLSFIEIPYSNGAAAFEIQVQKIVFSGGTTPFFWFGDTKTNNIHDGQSGSGSSLIASLVLGNSCASKMESDETVSGSQENIFALNAYPNPFSGKVNIEFMLTEDSRVKLEVFNISGQLLDVLFDGNAESSTLHKIEYTPKNISGGVIIYKLQTPKGIYYGKAVMMN